MKYFSITFLLLLSLSCFGQKPAGKYYAFAKSGLNMRSSASVSSEKVAKIPYGAVVVIKQKAGSADLDVDNLKGGMAKVEYNGQTGYAFDGFLVPFPAPKKNQNVEQYAEQLRANGEDVLYEEHRRDWGGYIQLEYAINLKTESWEEAWLIARNMWEIPEKLHFPKASSKEKETFVNPDKNEMVWADELVVERKSGKITQLHYGQRGEGGGWSVSLEYNEEEHAIRIAELQIAD